MARRPSDPALSEPDAAPGETGIEVVKGSAVEPTSGTVRADIWRYAALYDPVLPPAAWLTLGEGGTPAVALPALAAEVGLDRLVVKREDLNPTGSHKARGVAFQVAALCWRMPGVRRAVISSSGNAALAAAAYSAAAGLRLAAFVAPTTPPAKVRRLVRLGADVCLSAHALTLAAAVAERHGIPNLRPSTDPLAVEGFQSIGWEIAGVEPATDAVFAFVSSATSFVALGRAFARAGDVGATGRMPALHAVQGTGAHPVAGPFDPRPPQEARGRLGDRGARKTRRAGEAARWIARTGGGGWVITDAEADAAEARLLAHGIETSIEGAAALAAAIRAAARGGVRSATVLLTGGVGDGEEDPVGDEHETVDTPASGSGPRSPARMGRGRVVAAESLPAVEAALDL